MNTMILKLILIGVVGTNLSFISSSVAQEPRPPLTMPNEPQPYTTMVETLIVPFSLGTAGVQTTQSYSGTVAVTVAGGGQASGTQWSDAFYIYTDYSGQPIEPFHPTEYYNWTLWINGGPADNLIQPIPAYNDNHSYTFFFDQSGNPVTFAVGDIYTIDNTGNYTVTITEAFIVCLPFIEKYTPLNTKTHFY